MKRQHTQGQEVPMNTIREVIRLGLSGRFSLREIAASVEVTHPTAKKYMDAARQAHLTWPEITAMEDTALRALIKQAQPPKPAIKRPLPDFCYVHQELKKKGVTFALLWQEYKESHPHGYQETTFRTLYHQFARTLSVSLRQTHPAGKSMFVDYAGYTIPIHDRITGQSINAQIFVAVLGASNYTYAEATPTQTVADWIGSHVRALEYFGGVTERIVCDNLKSGVTTACRYQPLLNQSYADFARHYNVAIIPARAGKPQDKAKVETAVQIVERWILAALRNRKFFSIHELNTAIKELLIVLNQKPFKKLPGSRLSAFIDIEKPALKSLPSERYEYASFKYARVNIDYHIELEGHYYSVPYPLIGQQVRLRYTQTILEIFNNNRRIASHARSYLRGRHTTIHEHMPKSHQEFLSYTPSRILEQAKHIGTYTVDVITHILGSRRYPELGYRSCLGIIRLAKKYTNVRLEAACKRANAVGAYSYTSIRSILESQLDTKPLPQDSHAVIINHDNIRGNGYFTQEEAA